MDIKIIKDAIPRSVLKEISEKQFGDFVKAVVDIEKEIMAIGGSLHADEEAMLLEHGSAQENLWGINIYPQKTQEERIEFDSMINIRPSQGNRSRNIEDENIRKRIVKIVNTLIQ